MDPFIDPTSSYNTRPPGPPSRGESGVENRNLQDKIARLALICEAMWTILKEHHGYTDEMLALRLGEIDSADGKVDGRKPNVIVPCPSCERPLPAGKQVCLYCGTFSETAPVFNGFS